MEYKQTIEQLIMLMCKQLPTNAFMAIAEVYVNVMAQYNLEYYETQQY